MIVYVVTQRYPYSESDIVSVYQNIDAVMHKMEIVRLHGMDCLLYTSPSPRDVEESRMPSSA